MTPSYSGEGLVSAERWTEFFRQTLGRRSMLEYAVDHWQYHLPLYAKIRQYLARAGGLRVLDIGCGLGITATYLQECGLQVTGIDYRPDLIEQARQFARSLGSGVRLEAGDAFRLHGYFGQFDLVFSVGVLEHFDRAITVSLLESQSRCAPLVLLNIPSCHLDAHSDERFYTIRQMYKLMCDAGLEPFDYFAYGIPTWLLPWSEWLPVKLLRFLQYHMGWAINYCVVARAPARAASEPPAASQEMQPRTPVPDPVNTLLAPHGRQE
jgi:SAM-dependent methyltransferase